MQSSIVSPLFNTFDYPNLHLMIGGDTDSSGSMQRNLKLSQERAKGVKSDLVAMGISADRLDAKGYGAESPVAYNSTAEGRVRNRRVSMMVTQKWRLMLFARRLSGSNLFPAISAGWRRGGGYFI